MGHIVDQIQSHGLLEKASVDSLMTDIANKAIQPLDPVVNRAKGSGDLSAEATDALEQAKLGVEDFRKLMYDRPKPPMSST